MLISKDEAVAARRRVPMRLFTSNGTSPDTGASNDSIVMGVNSLVTIVPDVLVTAVGAAMGMYYVELSQSNVSVLGIHPLYHTQGDFPQHIANVEVVVFQPYSGISMFNPSTTSVGIKTSGVQPGAFDADSIDATALAAMNLSDVTVRIQPMDYGSALTIGGIRNFSNLSGTFSALTVQGTNVDLSTVAYGIISGTTLTEPSGVPAWPMKQSHAVAFMMAVSSNSLSQDSGLQTIRNRADSSSIATAPTSSSSTLFVRGSFT